MRRVESERNAAMRKLESETRFADQQAQLEQAAAQKKLVAKARADAPVKDMTEWLERNRLLHFVVSFTTVAGM